MVVIVVRKIPGTTIQSGAENTNSCKRCPGSIPVRGNNILSVANNKMWWQDQPEDQLKDPTVPSHSLLSIVDQAPWHWLEQTGEAQKSSRDQLWIQCNIHTQSLRQVDDVFLLGTYANLLRSMLLDDLYIRGKTRSIQKLVLARNYAINQCYSYLVLQVFFTSLRGARRPLAREPFDVNLNDDMTETNFSIDFSAISE